MNVETLISSIDLFVPAILVSSEWMFVFRESFTTAMVHIITAPHPGAANTQTHG